MSFARFLRTRPTDLSGISVHQPNFEALQGLLEGQQQGFDLGQALVDKIPNHADFDREGVKQVSEGLQSEMDEVVSIFTDKGVGAGNLALRNLTRKTGKLYQPGGIYNQVEANKTLYDQQRAMILADESLNVARKQKALAQITPDGFTTFGKNEDGTFNPDQVNTLNPNPVPKGYNHTEKSMKLAGEVMPDVWKNSTPWIKDGVVVGIITNENKQVTRAEIREVLENGMKGDPAWAESAKFYDEMDEVEAGFMSAIIAKEQNSRGQTVKISGGTKKKDDKREIKAVYASSINLGDRPVSYDVLNEMSTEDIVKGNIQNVKKRTEMVEGTKANLMDQTLEQFGDYIDDPENAVKLEQDDQGYYKLTIGEMKLDHLTPTEQANLSEAIRVFNKDVVIPTQTKLNEEIYTQDFLLKLSDNFYEELAKAGIRDVDSFLNDVSQKTTRHVGKYTGGVRTEEYKKSLRRKLKDTLGEDEGERIYNIYKDVGTAAQNLLQPKIHNEMGLSLTLVGQDNADVRTAVENIIGNHIETAREDIETITDRQFQGMGDKEKDKYRLALANGNYNAQVVYDPYDNSPTLVLTNLRYKKDSSSEEEPLDGLQIKLEQEEASGLYVHAGAPQDGQIVSLLSQIDRNLDSVGKYRYQSTNFEAEISRDRSGTKSKYNVVIPMGEERLAYQTESPKQLATQMMNLEKVIQLKNEGYSAEEIRESNILSKAGFDQMQANAILSVFDKPNFGGWLKGATIE